MNRHRTSQAAFGWRRGIILLLALMLVVGSTAVASACPTCKNAIAGSDPHHQNMVAGYYYSILFMMAMPFLLLGTFSSYMYLEVRRARAAENENQSEPGGENRTSSGAGS